MDDCGLNIFNTNKKIHENTIKHYNKLYNKQLDLYDLVKHAIKQDNYNLVNYLISKRLSFLEDIINTYTRLHGFIIPNLDDGTDLIEYLKHTDNKYYEKLNYYCDGKLEIDIEKLLKNVYKHEDWDMFWCIYNNEKIKIIDYCKEGSRKNDELLKAKNKKIFILNFV